MEAMLLTDLYLLDGGGIPNGKDAPVGSPHPQVVICDDGPEVGLTSCWQRFLQLHMPNKPGHKTSVSACVDAYDMGCRPCEAVICPS